jgi:hypothetical protein
MSKFLAPIHFWLYGKIQIMEDIEKNILTRIDNQKIQDKALELRKTVFDYINDTELESIIDQGNIHGWLQATIEKTETRQALLLDYAITQIPKDEFFKTVKAAYTAEGTELGKYKSDNKLNTAPELFKSLGDVLLEGMPCDRVNVLTENLPDTVNWDVVSCVHDRYWSQENIQVTDYYDFRAAFSKAFIENANPEFTYNFDNTSGQKHSISKI